MTALEYAQKIKESLAKVKKYADPYIEIMKERTEELVKEADILDRQEKGEKTLDPVTGKPIMIFPQDHMGKNIRLRKEMNDYLADNAEKKGDPEYQAVLEGYRLLTQKCEEDVKKYDEAVFNGALQAERERIREAEKQAELEDSELPSKEITGSAMKQIYIMMLKDEYVEADLQEKMGQGDQKTEAGAWKKEILDELYSDQLDQQVERFTREDPLGKRLYAKMKEVEGKNQLPLKQRISYAFSTLGLELLNEYHLSIAGEKNPEKLGNEDKTGSRQIISDLDRLKSVGDRLGVNTEIMDVTQIKFQNNLCGKYNDTYDRLIESLPQKEKAKKDNARKKEIQERKKKESEELKGIEKEIEEAKQKKAEAETNWAKMSKSIGDMVRGTDEAVDPKTIKDLKNQLQDFDREIQEAIGNIRRLNVLKDSAIVKHKENAEKDLQKDREENQPEENKDQKKEQKDRVLSWEEQRIKMGLLRKNEEKDPKTGETKVTYEKVPYAMIALQRKMNLLRLLGDNKITKEEYMDTALAEDANTKWDVAVTHPEPPKRRNRDGLGKETGLSILNEDKPVFKENNAAEQEPENRISNPKDDQIIRPADDEVKEVKEANEINEVKEAEFALQEDPEAWMKGKIARAEAAPQMEKRDTKKAISIATLVQMIEDADQGVWNGSSEYEVIKVALNSVGEKQKRLAGREEKLTGEQLKAEQTSILLHERHTAELMSHYLNRKQDEKKLAEAKGGRERTNSKKRRETIEKTLVQLQLHIRETEDRLGLSRGRERSFETVETKLKYANQIMLRMPDLKALIEKSDALRRRVEEGADISERMKLEKKLINDMQKYLYKNKRKVYGRKGYAFSMKDGRDGKPVEPSTPDEKAYQSVLKAYETLSNQLMKDISIYRPNQMEDTRSVFRKNNRIFETAITTELKPAEQECGSYADLIKLQEKQRDQLKREIYSREWKRKTKGKVWADNEQSMVALDNLGLEIIGLGLDDSVQIEEQYKYEPDKRESKLIHSVHDTMYAEIMQQKGYPYDAKVFRDGREGFHALMELNKSFNANLKKVLTEGFNLSGESGREKGADGWKGIDLSADGVHYARDIAFGTTLYGELSALNKELKKENPNREKLAGGLKALDGLSQLSKKIGTERIYDQRVPRGQAAAALKEVEKELTKKARQVLTGQKVREKVNSIQK